MKKRKNFVKVCFGCAGGLVLAACVEQAALPDIPAGTPFVEISNGGSIFGGNRTTVYEGDVAVFRANDGTPDSLRSSYAVLRSGGYDRLRAAAVDLIGQTQVQPEPACLDYGADVITVWSPVETLSVGAACPENDVLPAQAALRQILNEEYAQ